MNSARITNICCIGAGYVVSHTSLNYIEAG